MSTITFTYQGKNKEVYQNDAFIEDYSDEPEALAKIIRELTDLTCNLSLTAAPWDDKRHLKSEVTIGYRGNKLQFDFYHSLKDTEEWGIRRFDSTFLKDVLYSLLCTIKSDAGIYELDFDEFCAEYGYDEDSCKAHRAYRQCCAFSSRTARVFSDEEIGSFPS